MLGSAEVLRQAGDFHLLCTFDSRDISAQFLTTENEDGKFFMGIIAPGNAEGLETLPKDVVFCFDRSGSMQGEKIKQARNALKFCLGSLNPEDRFALLWFNDALHLHATALAACDDQSKRDAISAVGEVSAEGGTFIYGALERALQLFESNDRPKYLVFLTDGLPTVGDTTPAHILKSVKGNNTTGARLFTFGVGYDLNAGLLNDLADQNNGFSSYVAPDEDVEVAVSNFFRKMSRPVLASCRLEFERGVVINDMYPSLLPDVFAGNEIVVFGRFLNDGATKVHLIGTRGTMDVNHTFTVEFAPRQGQYPFIAKLWAGRRIGYLLDAMRVVGETAEVKAEVVRLSKRYGIMTPYTSFLAAPEEVRMAGLRNNRSLGDIPSIGVSPRMAPYSPQFVPGQRSALQTGEATTLRSIEASRLKSLGGAQGPSLRFENDLSSDQEASAAGKRFTNVAGVWTDWDAIAPTTAASDTLVIKPFSEAYFHLGQNRKIAEILSLGGRIIFLWGNVLIRIDESGAEKWNKDWPHL